MLDPTTGTVAASDDDARVLAELDGTVLLVDGTSLSATSPGGDELWSLSVTPTTTIAALGGVLLYLRDGGAVRVHNAITDEVTQGYTLDGQGTIIVPEQFTADGADVLLDNDRRLLATVEAIPTPDS